MLRGSHINLQSVSLSDCSLVAPLAALEPRHPTTVAWWEGAASTLERRNVPPCATKRVGAEGLHALSFAARGSCYSVYLALTLGLVLAAGGKGCWLKRGSCNRSLLQHVPPATQSGRPLDWWPQASADAGRSLFQYHVISPGANKQYWCHHV